MGMSEACELTTLMDEWMRDPEFVAAYEKEKARLDSATRVSCHFGHCFHDVDTTGHILGGMGPVMCPCDHLPGWKAPRPAGQARPAAPVKARGRHGSRVARSRLRHRLPDYSA